MKKSILIYSLLLTLAWSSCEEERSSTPRPHSYPRVEFTPTEYSAFAEDYCPITFEYPSHALINKKNFFFTDQQEPECWFNIALTEYEATLYFTYQELAGKKSLERLIDDAFLLVSKHNAKANSREESRISNPQGYEGVFFEIGGPVASPLQFYLTDKKHHFLRGSFYFNKGTANDSLQMITDHVREDMAHIINTTKFK